MALPADPNDTATPNCAARAAHSDDEPEPAPEMLDLARGHSRQEIKLALQVGQFVDPITRTIAPVTLLKLLAGVTLWTCCCWGVVPTFSCARCETVPALGTQRGRLWSYSLLVCHRCSWV